MGIKRALFFSAAERYTNVVVNFVLIAVVSRLLTPEEIGVSVFGVTTLALIEVFRDIPSLYIVQQRDLKPADIRTAVTTMVLISFMFAAALFFGAGHIAAFYDNTKIASYLHVLAFGVLVGPVERAPMALLRRDMAFQNVALANVASCAANALVTIVLVLLGFSFMSFAWALLAGVLTTGLVANAFRKQLWIYRPLLSEWRRALHFGGFFSMLGLIATGYDMLPYLLLSRLYPLDIMSLYNRVLMVTQIPDKLLLSGMAPVAFPALAAKARAGEDLKEPYLRALSYITAVQWPPLLLLALLAEPTVHILLGNQWLSIVPLVQITSLAMFFSFPSYVSSAMLVAIGAVKDLFYSTLVSRPIAAIVVVVAAFYGLKALALSLILTLSFNALVSQIYLRRHVMFSWQEFGAAVRPSGVVALASGLGPMLLVLVRGSFDLSIPMAIVAGMLALVGWLVGLRWVRHPLMAEILQLLAMLRQSSVGYRLAAAMERFGRRFDPLRSFLGLGG